MNYANIKKKSQIIVFYQEIILFSNSYLLTGYN